MDADDAYSTAEPQPHSLSPLLHHGERKKKKRHLTGEALALTQNLHQEKFICVHLRLSAVSKIKNLLPPYSPKFFRQRGQKFIGPDNYFAFWIRW